MNKLAFALAVTTAVFASTTVYFARAFHSEKERAAHLPAVRIIEKPALFPTPVEGTAAEKPADSAPATTPSSLPPGTYVRDKAAELAFSQARLRRLTDPAGRAEQLANITAMMRSERYTPAIGAGWTRDELDRVVAVLAERSLQRMEARLRCEVTAGCTAAPASTAANQEADRLEMVQLLGEEKVARYDRYLATADERGTVWFLRPRLSGAGPLSAAQEDRLVSALAEENRRFTEAAKLEGADISSYGFGSARIPAAGKPQTAEGRARMLESATEYARHLHDRAAEILTPAQLAEFDDMQTETLRSLRESARIMELKEPTRVP